VFQSHTLFWEEHPALLLALSFLGGVGAALFGVPIWVSALWVLYLGVCRKWASVGVWVIAALYAWSLYGSLPVLEEPLACRARFSIAGIHSHQSPFHRGILYRGTLYLDGHSFPCSMGVKGGKLRPKATSDYWVEGMLEQRGPFDYVFKPKAWTAVPYSWSLGEFRYKTKERLRAFLETRLKGPRTASFLYSLVSGDVEDRLLRYEFGRLGLQHILAISGFHFGVLMASFSVGLGLFLSRQWKWSLMLVCASLYFVFVGSSPAVERAWIGASLFLVSKLIRKTPNAINLLGSALLIELILHPLVAANLGFQLSFASCFGILLFSKAFEEVLQWAFPKRSLAISSKLALPAKCIYLASSWLRKSLGLTLSVNAAILPLLFYHFGRFPPLSLLYNLFYPFLVSLALLGLVIALLGFLLLGPLSAPLFGALDWWAKELLALVAYPPLVLDRCLYLKEVPAGAVLAYLFGFLMVGIWANSRLALDRSSN
jgi:competence protein ComEC